MRMSHSGGEDDDYAMVMMMRMIKDSHSDDEGDGGHDDNGGGGGGGGGDDEEDDYDYDCYVDCTPSPAIDDCCKRYTDHHLGHLDPAFAVVIFCAGSVEYRSAQETCEQEPCHTKSHTGKKMYRSRD